MSEQSTASTIVYVIDDDPSIRQALQRMLKSVGLVTELYASAEEFLEAPIRDVNACLILDLRLPGRSGWDLQQELLSTGSDLPIIFITAHWNQRNRDRAKAAGAIDMLAKPFDEESLLSALDEALGEQGIPEGKPR